MKETTRVQLELPKKSMDRLRRLKEMTEASSHAEVIRAALIHYEKSFEDAVAGGEK